MKPQLILQVSYPHFTFHRTSTQSSYARSGFIRSYSSFTFVSRLPVATNLVLFLVYFQLNLRCVVENVCPAICCQLPLRPQLTPVLRAFTHTRAQVSSSRSSHFHSIVRRLLSCPLCFMNFVYTLHDSVFWFSVVSFFSRCFVFVYSCGLEFPAPVRVPPQKIQVSNCSRVSAFVHLLLI